MEKCRRRLLLCAAPITFLLIGPLLCAHIFRGNIIIPSWMQNLSSSRADERGSLRSNLARLVRGQDQRKLETTGFACDLAENSIVCLANQPVKINASSSITIYTSSSSPQAVQEETKVKPYALQKDKYLLQWVSPVKILHKNSIIPICQHSHEIPAVIFSTGIVGNIFHELNDIVIPLFITINHFQSQVLLILDDYSPYFVTKYNKILSRLSKYEVMNPAANRSIHCFPGLILGLKYHDNLALNTHEIPGGYSMPDFRTFLRETYNLTFSPVSQIREPTLMFLSREKTRRFLNENEIIAMIRELGFRVIVPTTKEAMNLDIFANTVNRCGVLVGAHGAGLTNELFLPDGAVMVQVELLGTEWASNHYYGDPARAMGVHYLRYKIEPEESSLVELYGRDDSVVLDPESVYSNMGYRTARAVYLEQQNVRVDIVRFRKTLLQALQLVKMHS